MLFRSPMRNRARTRNRIAPPAASGATQRGGRRTYWFARDEIHDGDLRTNADRDLMGCDAATEWRGGARGRNSAKPTRCNVGHARRTWICESMGIHMQHQDSASRVRCMKCVTDRHTSTCLYGTTSYRRTTATCCTGILDIWNGAPGSPPERRDPCRPDAVETQFKRTTRCVRARPAVSRRAK